MPDHSGTIALITGGTQGLGLAIAEALVATGCRKLVLVGRDADKGAAAAAMLRGPAEVAFLRADLSDIGQVQGIMPAALAQFGRITALVNCAGNTARGSILDTTPALWDDLVNTNARAPFFLIQDFARAAIAAHHSGSAVNIISMAAHCGQSFLAPYAASKAALANITRNAANALAPRRIRVNAINAGWMDTEAEDAIQRAQHGATDGWQARAGATLPLGALINPAHVAALASYMLSPDSGVMTGSVVDFDQHVNGATPE